LGPVDTNGVWGELGGAADRWARQHSACGLKIEI
jgi:hypothetical protein